MIGAPLQASAMAAIAGRIADAVSQIGLITQEEVRSAIQVTSSRTSAVFGFNMAEVQIHLPRVDNGIPVMRIDRGGQIFWITLPPQSSNAFWKPPSTSWPKA